MTDEARPDSPMQVPVDYARLLRAGSAEADRLFNSLTHYQQVALVLSAPWDKRQDVVLLSENPAAIVQSLPEQELYWTVKERGIDESLAIISRTSQEQFQYLIDLDCWKGDLLDPGQILKWLAILGRCHEHKVVEWFRCADESFLIGSLKKFMHVRRIEEESDISEEYDGMPQFTLDNINYFSFSDDGARMTLMPLLNALYQNDPGLFHEVLEGVIWHQEIEMEDEALRWRTARIADSGFPGIEEAMAIYQELPEGETERLRVSIASAPDVPVDARACVLRCGFDDERVPGFLAAALRCLEDIHADRVQQVLLFLASKSLVADVRDRTSIQDLRLGLQKVCGFVSIGLEYLTGRDPARAVAALASVHPQTLFQTGYSCAVRLQRRIRNYRGRIWLGHDSFYAFYGSPWADTVAAVAARRPEMYDGASCRGGLMLRPLASMADLDRAAHAFDILRAADQFVFDVCGVEPSDLSDEHLSGTTLGDAGAVSCIVLLCTAFARQVLQGRSEVVALESAELQQFVRVITGPEGLSAGLRDQACAWAVHELQEADIPVPAVRDLVDSATSALAEDFSGTDTEKSIDTRYVTSLLLKRDT